MHQTSRNPLGCPLSSAQVIDRYFLEHRAKLLDIAAFLDRIDRAAAGEGAGGGDDPAAASDHRMQAFAEAIEVLRDGQGERAKRVQEVFSDFSETPAASAAALGPADGAPPSRT